VVFVLDVAKGALPVVFLPRLSAVGASPSWALAYGLAAIAGHVRTPYLLWTAGGKGVATAAGVFLALSPVCVLVATGVWAIVLTLSGYVSLASLTGAVALAVALGVREGPRSPVFALGIVVTAFVFWTHRANLGRLHRGVEPRVGHQPPAD
jgi:glycerol-3-phosphate acyltransferase PlsY